MKSKTLFYLILITLLTLFIPAVHAQTFTVLHTFTGELDGGLPFAGVTIRGNALYGTTNYHGNVCQLTRSGSDWLFSNIAVLPNSYPGARVVFGPDGHLYGTTYPGGPYYWGTVFKLTPQVKPCWDAACYWKVNDLHDFGSGTDGRWPNGDLIWDQQGNMYGTTWLGGESGGDAFGTVYELTPSGNGYTESVLYSFSGAPDGANPYDGLVFDNQGNLFGTTPYGGTGTGCDYDLGCGTVFELTYVVGVGWTEHVLYSFQNGSDGAWPAGALIFDSAGNLYGTASAGGEGGGGTVFELSPSGDTWTFKLLYSFSGPPEEYCGPLSALAMDGAGNLYGNTYCGGIYDYGSVFKLSNTENGWVYTSLHDFNFYGTDGGNPVGIVSIDTDGTLYGTTQWGGDYGLGWGTVWMFKP